jgi:hypothetical protein
MNHFFAPWIRKWFAAMSMLLACGGMLWIGFGALLHPPTRSYLDWIMTMWLVIFFSNFFLGVIGKMFMHDEAIESTLLRKKASLALSLSYLAIWIILFWLDYAIGRMHPIQFTPRPIVTLLPLWIAAYSMIPCDTYNLFYGWWSRSS